MILFYIHIFYNFNNTVIVYQHSDIMYTSQKIMNSRYLKKKKYFNLKKKTKQNQNCFHNSNYFYQLFFVLNELKNVQ